MDLKDRSSYHLQFSRITKMVSVPSTLCFLCREKKAHLWLEIPARWECTQCPYLARLWSKYDRDFFLLSFVYVLWTRWPFSHILGWDTAFKPWSLGSKYFYWMRPFVIACPTPPTPTLRGCSLEQRQSTLGKGILGYSPRLGPKPKERKTAMEPVNTLGPSHLLTWDTDPSVWSSVSLPSGGQSWQKVESVYLCSWDTFLLGCCPLCMVTSSALKPHLGGQLLTLSCQGCMTPSKFLNLRASASLFEKGKITLTIKFSGGRELIHVLEHNSAWHRVST